jgi:uncharacterized membrane protein YkoI
MLFLPLLLVCGAALARAREGAPPCAAAAATALVLASAAISVDEAVKLAEQRYHARVVKAETEQDNGRTVYVLRLLSDAGRVWTVRVDAASGTVL